MSSGAKVGLVVAILAVAAIIGYAVVYQQNNQSTVATTDTSTVAPTHVDQNTPTPVATTPTPIPSATPAATPSASASATASATPVAAATITYANGAFSPATTTIAVGGTVTFTNGDASMSVNIASDPHPTHTDYPALNLGLLAPGKTSKTLTFSAAGTHGYHNHLNSTETGTIVVK